MPAATWLDQEELAVALSGGGHRATLYGLGSLLALVDLRLNSQVHQIASVSGGSITNAYVAWKCDFRTVTTAEFDEIAGSLARAVVNVGVLSPLEGLAVLGGTAIPGIGALLGLLGAGAPAAVAAGIGLFGVGAAWLLRGLIVETLIAHRIFGGSGAPLFGDLKAGPTRHTFCCTNLPTGLPFYFSSWQGGHAYARQPNYLDGSQHTHSRRCCAAVPLAAAVRASAAFPPLIAPRRFDTSAWSEECPRCLATQSDEIRELRRQYRPYDRFPKLIFLSDGGVWNNLATQPITEGVLLEYGSFVPSIVLVANASAPMEPIEPWQFQLPLFAELLGIERNANILNANTVEPRRVAFRDQLRRQIERRELPSSLDPWVMPLSINQGPVNIAVEFAAIRRKVSAAQWPWDDARSWDPEHLLSHHYERLEPLEGKRPATVSTTLAKIDRDAALRLIMRGYGNTHVAVRCIDPKRAGEPAALERFSRLL